MRKAAWMLAAAMAVALGGCGDKNTGEQKVILAAGAEMEEAKDGAGDKAEGKDKVPEEKDRNGETGEEALANLDGPFNTTMDAWFTEGEKTGYLPLGNGQCLELHADEGITFATVTPDRKHVIVKLKNDVLYVTDIRQKEKEILSGRCTSSRMTPSNEGMGFLDSTYGEKHLMRYRFGDKKMTDMGACPVGRISENAMAMAGMNNGDLCVLRPGSDEISRYSGVGNNEIKLNRVSNDGNTAVWTEETSDSFHEMLYTLGENGEEQLLGEIETRGMVHTEFSADGKLALVTSDLAEHLYLKDAAGQWKRVELPGEWKNETTVYETDAGLLHEAMAEDVHEIYLRCGNRLCAVSMDGTVTVVRDSVRDFDVYHGRLYYSDREKNIYEASLNGAKVTEERALLQGVDAFAAAPGGKYLYCLRIHPENEKVRTLSVYPLQGEGGEETVISEQIYADSHVYLMEDGERIFYVDEAKKPEGMNRYTGTLKIYHADSGETEAVDEEVYEDSFTNGKEWVILSEYGQSMAGAGKIVQYHGDLTYRKRPEGNEDGYRFDWYFYDGKTSTRMAKDLVY